MKNLCLSCRFWSYTQNKRIAEKGDWCRVTRDKF